MTLNGRYTLYYYFGARHKSLNENKPMQSAAKIIEKCRPMTLVSGNIKYSVGYMRIFAGVPQGWDVKRQWGYRRRQFSEFSVDTSSETLEIRRALLYGDNIMQSLGGLQLIPK